MVKIRIKFILVMCITICALFVYAQGSNANSENTYYINSPRFARPLVVSYADAATGAQQTKLLGLSGIYVQMLTENIPNYRGASIPYSLGYIPGTWMQSIQVSKGCSSMKNTLYKRAMSSM